MPSCDIRHVSHVILSSYGGYANLESRQFWYAVFDALRDTYGYNKEQIGAYCRFMILRGFFTIDKPLVVDGTRYYVMENVKRETD